MAVSVPRRTRRARGTISAELILNGAFEVASRDGLVRMSMPSIAEHLGVGVTSLYWYYRSKEDLLQQMRATARLQLLSALPTQKPASVEHWRRYFTLLFRATHEFYAKNALVAELILMPANESEAPATLLYESVEDDLGFLMRVGFTPQYAWNFYSTLSMYTHSVAATDRKRRDIRFPPDGEGQLSLVNTGKTPILASLIRDHGVSLDFAGSTFEPGLEIILNSAETWLRQHQQR